MMAWYKVGVPLDSILQMASPTTFKQISKNLSVSSVVGRRGEGLGGLWLLDAGDWRQRGH
jgi:hypothetical protein